MQKSESEKRKGFEELSDFQWSSSFTFTKKPLKRVTRRARKLHRYDLM